MSVSPVLARTLAAGRPQFNARVAAARRARSGFDAEAFAQAIRVRLDPVVVAVDALAAERVGTVTEAGFDVILGLAGHGVMGERGALVDLVWCRLGTAYAHAVAERPFASLAMLTNAALTIAATPGARIEEWTRRMAEIAPQVTAETLRATGQVVAWRSGMAHYREGAIAAADGLPDAVAGAAVGAAGGWAEVRAALVDDPWWTPEGGAKGVTIGAFTGFGGAFAEPPAVRVGAQGFVVRSGAATHLLIADAWGATLHPVEAAEFDAAAANDIGDARTLAPDLPVEGLAAVASATGVAITSRYSHQVRIGPWPTR